MKIILFIAMFAGIAQASFLIEPYAGLNVNGAWSDNGEDSLNQFTGTMYGARAGIQKLGLMIGMDGRKGSWEISNDNKTELDYTHIAAFIGYDFPILLRVYAEYIIGGNALDQDENEFLQPSGFIAGAGYKFFPFLSANLEFGNVEYKEVEDPDGVNADRDDNASYLLISLSAPINLGL